MFVLFLIGRQKSLREKTKAMSPLETIPHFSRDVGGIDFLNEGEVPQLCVLWKPEVKVLCVKGGLMIISSFRCHGFSLKKKNFLHGLFFICRNRRIEFLFKFI